MHIDFIELGNFRKLQNIRVVFGKKKTVFVGANNSGKTSAMVALRYFLVEKERTNFSFNDFTLSHWQTLDEMGKEWEATQADNEALPTPDWRPIAPFLDVWLDVPKAQSHYVQKLIPTLDWDGGRLGVRLRYEPRNAEQLQKDFLVTRAEAKAVEAADKEKQNPTENAEPIILWPKNFTEFLRRRLSKQFTVKAYILDPSKVTEHAYGHAHPQSLEIDAEPIDGDPFKGLIRIDEIDAQRGFSQSRGAKDADDSATSVSSSRKMSDQLRKYWNKHLDPLENPDASDIEALRALGNAEQAFDERLREGFSEAFSEVESLGYPGVTDPSLKISSRIKPVDGLNHDAALQYMVKVIDGDHSIDLSLPENSNGLGYQNLVSMVFRLMSFRDAWVRVRKAGANNTGDPETLMPPLHLVLIEEPEAHLHTQVQQVFIRKAYDILRKHKELGDKETLITQMLVSTHSSHVAHECDFDELRYFRRIPAEAKGVPTSTVVNMSDVFGENTDTKRFVTRYLRVTHSDLFFADAAILVEGPAERMLVPFFVNNDDELEDLAECYITWLEIGGSHAHRLRPLIEKLGLTTLIITDLDAMNGDREAVSPQRKAKQKSRNKTLETWCPKLDSLDELLNVSCNKKILKDNNTGYSIRVAYQCPVKIVFKGGGVEAISNTLEDAVVLQNIDFFSDTDKKGLFKKFQKSIKESTTIEALAALLFENLKNAPSGSKAEFSLDLLEIKDPKALEAPAYIKEGLVWLSAELRKRQGSLGLATAASKPNKVAGSET